MRVGYVKNSTAHYRLLLDEILKRRAGFVRGGSGHMQIFFTLNVDKKFNRGHID